MVRTKCAPFLCGFCERTHHATNVDPIFYFRCLIRNWKHLALSLRYRQQRRICCALRLSYLCSLSGDSFVSLRTYCWPTCPIKYHSLLHSYLASLEGPWICIRMYVGCCPMLLCTSRRLLASVHCSLVRVPAALGRKRSGGLLAKQYSKQLCRRRRKSWAGRSRVTAGSCSFCLLDHRAPFSILWNSCMLQKYSEFVCPC